MIILCYICTFTVYPNGCNTPIFFNNTNDTWKKMSFTTIAFIYNICDTTGRKLCKFIPINKVSLTAFTIGRFILFITIPINVVLSSKGYNYVSGFMVIGNVILFASTNGISNTLCYAFAPKIVSVEKKGRAAASIGFFTVVGIVTGSLTAFIMNEVLKAIQKQYPTDDLII